MPMTITAPLTRPDETGAPAVPASPTGNSGWAEISRTFGAAGANLQEAVRKATVGRSWSQGADVPALGAALGLTVAAGGMSWIGSPSVFMTVARVLFPLLLAGVAAHFAHHRGWRDGYDTAARRFNTLIRESATELALDRTRLEMSYLDRIQNAMQQTLTARDHYQVMLAIRQERHDRELHHRAEMARIEADHEARLKSIIRNRRLAVPRNEGPTGEGYLYVLEFSTSSIKVGMTEDPRRRLGQHLGEAKAFGVYVVNYWISPSCHNFKANETRLINACTRVSKQRSRKEYFHDVPYTQAVGFAGELSYFSKNTEQTSVEGVWA